MSLSILGFWIFWAPLAKPVAPRKKGNSRIERYTREQRAEAGFIGIAIANPSQLR